MDHLFACPACAGPLQSGPWRCEACALGFDTGDGVATFIRQGMRTRLDDLDYDAHYRVDRSAALQLQEQCRAFLGDLLPCRVRNFLEVGAGTGLFTLGFLACSEVDHALVTDISHQMLLVNRERLAADPVASQCVVTHALWDGEASCLADGAFDFVAGFSVLHHVLDYSHLLTQLRQAMTPDGRAVFLEPSLAFHRALKDFVTQVIWNVPSAHPAWTLEDRLRVMAWIGEIHTNVKYRGDAFVLQAREDKHMFEPEALAAACHGAGFAHVRTIAFGRANEVATTLGVYLNQLGLRQAARDDFLARCARMLPGPFAYLGDDDCAPSLLLVADCRTTDQPPPRAASAGLEFAHPSPAFRFQMEFAAGEAIEGKMELAGGGWIVGDTDVRYVLVRPPRGGLLKFPVAGIRADVDAAINQERDYPPERTLFCGLLNPQAQSLPADGVAVDVIVETMDARHYRLGTLVPAPGSACRLEVHGLTPELIDIQGHAQATRYA